MKRFRFSFLTAVIACVLVSGGWTHGFSVTGNTGRAQINLGNTEFSAGVVNILRAGVSLVSSMNGNSFSVFDDDGYPVSAFSGFGIGVVLPALSATQYTVTWPSTRTTWKAFIQSANASGCSTTGGPTVANCSGSGSLTITPAAGIAGSVTFTAAGGAANWFWDPTGTFGAGSGVVALVRTTDLSRYNSGIYFTQEFEQTFAGISTSLLPKEIRVMGWTQQTSSGGEVNIANYANRTKTTTFSWLSGQFPNAIRLGTITTPGSSAGQVGQYTAGIGSVSTAAWSPYEEFIGELNSSILSPSVSISGAVSNGGNVQLTVNSSAQLAAAQSIRVNTVGGTTEANGVHTILTVDDATHITINVSFVHAYTSGGTISYQTLAITGKSGGAKFIVNKQGFGSSTLASSTSGAGTYWAHFFYDSILDALVYDNTNVSRQIPIEAIVQLCNRTGIDLWYNLPTYGSDSTGGDNLMQQSYTAISTTLNASRIFRLEIANEDWNPGFSTINWYIQRGIALGLTTASMTPYEGLRVAQVFSAMPKLQNMLRFYGFQSSSPAVSGLSGSLLAAYGFNASPNRPIDNIDRWGGAPYVAGLGLSGLSQDVTAGGSPVAPTIYDAPNLQTIINNQAAGNTSAAASGVDALIRNGRNRVQSVTASGTTFTTPLAHNIPVNSYIRFDVSGGTAYSGINTKALYQVLTTPTSSTFTAGLVADLSVGSAVNAGSAGSGTMDVGFTAGGSGVGNQGQNIFALSNWEALYWQKITAVATSPFSPAPANTILIDWYEGNLEPTANLPSQLSSAGVTAPNSVSFTATETSGNGTLASVSSTAGLVVGMTVTGTGIATNCAIASINSGASTVALAQQSNGSTVFGAFANLSASTGCVTASGSQSLTADDAYLQLYNALNVNWKSSALAAATSQFYYNTFVGLESTSITFGQMANARGVSNLVLVPSSFAAQQWSLFDGPSLSSTRYTTFNGFCLFSTGGSGACQ